MVAINTLMKHVQRESILRQAEIDFILMEQDPSNATSLVEVVRKLPKHPKVHVQVVEGDFHVHFKEGLDRIDERGNRLAPAFVFMDPYGYSIPMELVRRVLGHPNCEVMVNFMAQPVTRAVRDSSKAENLNRLYGSEVWRQAIGIACFHDQMERLIQLYVSQVGAKWNTKLRLTGQTDYTLIHFTNHDEGRATMKKAIWAVTGKYGKPGVDQLLFSDNPAQPTLISLEPDLAPLANKLRRCFAGKHFTYDDLQKWLLLLEFKDVHLNEVLKEGRQQKWLVTEHTRVFGPSMGQTPMMILGEALL